VSLAAAIGHPTPPMRQRLIESAFLSAPYRWWIGRASKAEFRPTAVVPWSGSLATANALFQGRYDFAGHRVEAGQQPPWRLRAQDTAWSVALHGFHWLDHFASAGGETAQAHARRLVRSWIDLCARIEQPFWRADVLAERLTAWTNHAVFLSAGAEPGFLAALVNSIVRQMRHLGYLLALLPPGPDRLVAANGLAFAAVSLGDEPRLARALQVLAGEVAGEVPADGGHRSRSPGAAHALLRRLVLLAELLRASGREVPDWLGGAIERLVAVVRLCRHGDGGLALYHGGFEEAPSAVDETLKRIAGRTRPAPPVSAGGYVRLAAQRTICIVDASDPPGGRAAADAHWSRGGIELSVGKQRLVVNCGPGAGRGEAWQAAGKHTAAHSALVVADTDDQDPGAVVATRRQDDAGNQWLELTSHGYAKRFGLVHDRRLYLDASGTDLRGADLLGPATPGGRVPDHPFAIRFHLHPDVHVARLNAADQLLLKLPAGQGWRFRSAGAELSIEESVYLGRQGEMRRSQQIVLSGRTQAEGTEVKWALRKA
jgi:uncharacterized heparinase superfamily protein